MSDAREKLTTAAFIEVANALASDYDVGEFLHMLVGRCSEALNSDAVSVLLEAQEGTLQLAAATSERMRELEDLEIRLGQGPCVETYRQGAPVSAGDMRKEQDRWPATAPKAMEIGLLAVNAFPLKVDGDSVGAFNVYREAAGALSDEELRLTQAFADVATVGILRDRKVSEAERRAEQLQGALDSRVLIEQAKGVLAERQGISTELAFDMIRRYARNHHRKLRGVCQQIIAGDEVDFP